MSPIDQQSSPERTLQILGEPLEIDVAGGHELVLAQETPGLGSDPVYNLSKVSIRQMVRCSYLQKTDDSLQYPPTLSPLENWYKPVSRSGKIGNITVVQPMFMGDAWGNQVIIENNRKNLLNRTPLNKLIEEATTVACAEALAPVRSELATKTATYFIQ